MILAEGSGKKRLLKAKCGALATAFHVDGTCWSSEVTCLLCLGLHK